MFALVVFVLREFGIIDALESDGIDQGASSAVVDRQSVPSGVNDRLVRAIELEESGVLTGGKGVVVKVLADDNEGDRHQRFIVELPTGQTILIAHNIDLAKRVPLEEFDVVEFMGQFEWNDRGGVMHWTHHDPGGWREGGWIKHEGVQYE